MKQPVRNRPRKPSPTRIQAIMTGARSGGLTPLDYMLSVIRDPEAHTVRRDRLAIAAAPYCHPRMADYRKGAKDLKAELADEAGAGSEWSDDLQYSDGRTRQ
jgi:phage terminase small subunit